MKKSKFGAPLRVAGAVAAMVFATAVMAKAQPGPYVGIEGFGSKVKDVTAEAPNGLPPTTTTSTTGCLLPIDLLGGNNIALGSLCLLGPGLSTTTTTPGSGAPVSFGYDYKSGYGGGLTFGYSFDNGLRPELEVSYSTADIDGVLLQTTTGTPTTVDANGDVQALRGMFNLWYDIDLGSVVPYLGGGIGAQQTKTDIPGLIDSDSDTTFGWQGGAGVGFAATERLTFSVDYRYIGKQKPTYGTSNQPINTTYQAQNLGLSLRYAFGEADGDDDGDGVPNRLDKCPGTPKGVTVYSDGCPTDLDGDGVPDYLDKCPNTPKGVMVNTDGCPLDSDGDGVPDSQDKCPGTPPGARVDANGCPLDSDGDGIPDYLDQCPGSPPGTKVDASGCPFIDSDGDGVPDQFDRCPNTPRGQQVGADGCPLDSDGDGIPDYLDQCPNTPPGLKVLPDGCAPVGDCRKPRPGEPVDAKGCALDKRFILRGVKFEFDSDRLTAEAKVILDSVAETLKAYPSIALDVEGHTDSVGSDNYNLGLSERRALSVKRYLGDKSVNTGRMRPVGYGESVPIDSNDTEAGRENNRRVEFKVTEGG